MSIKRTRQALPAEPREVGFRYYSGYWRQSYVVLAITLDAHGRLVSCTERDDADGRVRTHGTAWDHKRDRQLFV